MLEACLFEVVPEGVRLIGRSTDASITRILRDRIIDREQRKLDHLRADEPADLPPAEPTG